jgi:peptidase C39-like protein
VAKKQRRSPDAQRNTQLAAWIELSHLRAMEVLPQSFEKARIAFDDATPVYDVNGELLFMRVPLLQTRTALGWADVAVHPTLGEPLLATSTGAPWDPEALTMAGRKAARALGFKEADKADVRFVAYSYPKVALQFLAGRKEVVMLELFTWIPVPPSTRGPRIEPPSNFERWSFLDEMPDDERAARIARFDDRLGRWQDYFRTRAPRLDVIDSRLLLSRLDLIRLLFASRELHFSTRNSDHFTCYEVRGQETSVWCVAASVQMLLDFYRYEYTQVRLASELGLGTLSNPSGLPYSRDGDVVTVIEKMSVNALDAAMNTTPTFSEFVAEIDANRPLVSFVPGHSRTVAGYYRSYLSIIGAPAFRGLLVYDPWPPNAGVITRWENFNATTYRRTFTAHVHRA